MGGAGLNYAPVVFQSTRPRGARPDGVRDFLNVKKFQSTRLRGARPGKHVYFSAKLEFQSTRPRGARQRSIIN